MTTASKPRIGIAGIAIESSTFTPYRSNAADFEIRRGHEVLERYPFFTDGSASGKALREAADYVPVLHARALPGGVLERTDYDAWKTEILTGLSAAHAETPLHGFFFDIHGAMSVAGLEDAEGDLITAIREVIGPEVIVGTAMDLHGNVSATLFEDCDLLTCYRTAPHEDAWETRERGLRDLVEAASSGNRPYKALAWVPILLPGEKTSTRIEPAASLYSQIPELTAHPGVTDVSYWVGFAWADQPRCKAAIVAFGDDREAVDDAVFTLATAVWQARHDFAFVAPTGTFDDCLHQAIDSTQRPFWISDSGDNPGAGGADDTTYCLARMLAHPQIRSAEASALLVSIVDPQSVQHAYELGEGAVGAFTIGARIDTRPPGPVALTARVEKLAEIFRAGRCAVLRVLAEPNGAPDAAPETVAGAGPDEAEATGLRIVITQRRSQWATRDMFAAVGLTMDAADVVVVKMGYLEPDQYDAAADWMLALTPGGVDQDLLRLEHKHIDRPMIPFDAEIPAPTREDFLREGGAAARTPSHL